jgi:hypothetical protein
MLLVLAQRHPTPLTKLQLRILSGYAPGTFRTYMPALNRNQLVEITGENVSLTPRGLEEAGGIPPNAPRTSEQIRRMWLDNINAGPRRILEVLIEVYPQALEPGVLAERSGYAPGTFRTYMPKLTGLRLAERKAGAIRASDALFMDESSARGSSA